MGATRKRHCKLSACFHSVKEGTPSLHLLGEPHWRLCLHWTGLCGTGRHRETWEERPGSSGPGEVFWAIDRPHRRETLEGPSRYGHRSAGAEERAIVGLGPTATSTRWDSVIGLACAKRVRNLEKKGRVKDGRKLQLRFLLPQLIVPGHVCGTALFGDLRGSAKYDHFLLGALPHNNSIIISWLSVKSIRPQDQWVKLNQFQSKALQRLNQSSQDSLGPHPPPPPRLAPPGPLSPSTEAILLARRWAPVEALCGCENPIRKHRIRKRNWALRTAWAGQVPEGNRASPQKASVCSCSLSYRKLAHLFPRWEKPRFSTAPRTTTTNSTHPPGLGLGAL